MPLTVAWNIEEFVSFLSAKYCVYVCVCVYLYCLNTDGLLWIYKALNDATCYSRSSTSSRGTFTATRTELRDLEVNNKPFPSIYFLFFS